MNDSKSPKTKTIKQWGNRIFVFVVVVFLVGSLISNWQKVQSFDWQVQPIGVLLAVVAYISFFVLRGIVWTRTINLLETELSFRDGLRIYTYTYASRYIPGAVWTLVTLNTLAHNLGRSKRIFTFAFFLNIILLIVVDFIYLTPFVYLTTGILGFIAYGLFIYSMPFVIRIGLQQLSRFNFVPESTNLSQFTQPHEIFRLFNFTIIHQVFQLLAYFLFITSMTSLQSSQIAYLTIAYAVSWLVGFLIIFIPQGLGIREFSFIFLTASIIKPEIAIAISVALRLLTIGSEFGAFFLILGYDKLSSRTL